MLGLGAVGVSYARSGAGFYEPSAARFGWAALQEKTFFRQSNAGGQRGNMRRRRPLFRALTHTGNLPTDVRYRTDAFDYCRLCIDPVLPIVVSSLADSLFKLEDLDKPWRPTTC